MAGLWRTARVRRAGSGVDDDQLPGRDVLRGLGQEALRAPGRARRSAPQTAEQHHPGLGAGSELRVVATDLGVAERRALHGAAVDRDDRGVQVDRQRPGQVGGSCTGGPQPSQQLTTESVELADVGPLMCPQPRSDRRGRPGRVEQLPRGDASAGARSPGPARSFARALWASSLPTSGT